MGCLSSNANNSPPGQKSVIKQTCVDVWRKKQNALAIRRKSWTDTNKKKKHPYLKGSVESGKKRMIQKGNDFPFNACSVSLFKTAPCQWERYNINFIFVEFILHHIPCYDSTSWFSPLPSWHTTPLCLSVQPNGHFATNKNSKII